ncbi:hypothetical protein [Actinokineospora spheciospongiae]|uniref:hypothetical protein n=1 Tax=Actinokineospora spheciospongiae TaxID=909613 RepID=UPI000D713011|nr:hypothetical protein [Actinokineospora spheciospongiae]PWW64059.1 hypothetical protein DFQ13_10325 [Actinokineospora spheciospongiae]
MTTAPPETTAPSPLRRVARSATTTPGRLSVIWAGLLLLTIATGIVSAVATQAKQDTLDELLTQREPLAAVAQQIFRSLSDADATAASAFLSGGVEPPELRARYELDIATAGEAVGAASSDLGDDPVAAGYVSTLSRQLPVYTGLVETARANNRQGFPAGAAYLREASGLMRSKILPAAEQLYGIDHQRLRAAQDEARALPWGPVALTAALLVALLAAQVHLTRRTNRLLNVGLVVATAAVVVAVAWASVALLLAADRVDDAQRNGSAQADVLVHARINALKCRADETLTLVARGDGPGYEAEWQQLAATLTGDSRDNLLRQAQDLAPTDAVRQAVDNASAWQGAHRRIRELDGNGQYEEAVTVAVGQAPDSAATTFAALDDNLRTAIDASRAEFATQTTGAAQVTTGLTAGVALLTTVAAAGISAGIRERLREYR